MGSNKSKKLERLKIITKITQQIALELIKDKETDILSQEIKKGKELESTETKEVN